MLVSVIIPTFNRADVIIRSLSTWATQNLMPNDFEVIVVDNNSSDASPELIKNYIADKPNFYYLLEKQAGSTFARHAGARIAKGDILIFSDDDGLFNPECIEAVLEVYKKHPAVVAVTGKIEVEWDKEAPDWITPYLYMLGALNYGEEIVCETGLYLNGGLFTIRKDCFEALGGFNPDLIGLHLVGDGDTGLVVKLHETNSLIGYTPKAIMKHLQQTDKQGTITDIGRRFYNTGISNTYALFRKNKFKITIPVIKYMLLSGMVFLKKSMEYAMRKDYKSFFGKQQKKGEIAFWLNLRHRYIRKEVTKSDCYHY